MKEKYSQRMTTKAKNLVIGRKIKQEIADCMKRVERKKQKIKQSEKKSRNKKVWI